MVLLHCSSRTGQPDVYIVAAAVAPPAAAVLVFSMQSAATQRVRHTCLASQLQGQVELHC
jgi:hypothetical protein